MQDEKNTFNSETLKEIWDHFFNAETGTYEKTLWLDILLAEILIQSNNGVDVLNLESIWHDDGIATLVACELLCGIHRATSTISNNDNYMKKTDYCSGFRSIMNIPCFVCVENELSEGLPLNNDVPILTISQVSAIKDQVNLSLAHYILKSSGWRCLAMLKMLKLNELSCHRQLIKVLMRLFDEINKISSPHTTYNPYLLSSTQDELVDTLSSQIKINENIKINKLNKNRRYVYNKKVSDKCQRRRSYLSLTNIKEKKCRYVPFKNEILYNVHYSDSESMEDLEYKNQSFAHQKSCQEKVILHDHKTVKAVSKVTSNEKKKTVNEYISDSHKVVMKSEISPLECHTLIAHLLQKLCLVETKGAKSETVPVNLQCFYFSIKELCNLQFKNTPIQTVPDSDRIALKILLLKIFITSVDKINSDLEHGAKIFRFDIVQLLLKLLRCINNETRGMIQSYDDKNTISNISLFLYTINFSIFYFIFSMMMRNYLLMENKNFLVAFKLLQKDFNQTSLNDNINLMFTILSSKDDNRKLIKKLVENISNFIIVLKKVRCDYYSPSHFNKKHKSYHAPDESILHHHNRAIFGEYYIHSLTAEPKCCISFLYNILISYLEMAALTSNTYLIAKTLMSMRKCGSCCCYPLKTLLEKIVIIVIKFKQMCFLCFGLLEHIFYVESECIKFECSLQVNLENDLCILEDYINIFKTDDVSLMQNTMNHLHRIMTYCSANIKHHIAFYVIYPLLISTKDRYLSIESNECVCFLLRLCLSYFSTILCEEHMIKQFTTNGGLESVKDLINHYDFYEFCYTILENILRYDFSQTQQNFESPLKSLCSIQTFHSTLEKLVYEIFIYLKSITVNVSDEIILIYNNLSNESKYIQIETNIKSNKIREIELLEKFQALLKVLCSLCLCSSSFRRYISMEKILNHLCNIQKIFVHIICNNILEAKEKKTYVQIVEYLLKVDFATTGYAMNESNQSTLNILSEYFSSGNMDINNVKDIIDMLLRVSCTYIDGEVVLLRPTKPKFIKSICDYEYSSESEDHACVQKRFHTSDESELYHTADEGYEGDVEITNKISNGDLKDTDVVNPSKLTKLNENIDVDDHGQIHFPETFATVLDILLALTQRWNESADNSAAEILRACYDKISLILSLDHRFTESGIINKILCSSIKILMQETSDEFKNLKKSIFNLIYVLATHNISAKELKLYLNLFTLSYIPLDMVLNPLLKLSQNQQKNIPDFILCFPIKKESRKRDHIESKAKSKKAKNKSNAFKTLESQHLNKGINSSWVSAATICNITDLNFLWTQGFSVTMWLRIQNSTHNDRTNVQFFNQKEIHKPARNKNKHTLNTKTSKNVPEDLNICTNGEMLHLFSIGSDVSVIEFWANYLTGDLIIQIMHSNTSHSLIGKISIEKCIPLLKWNLIAINMKEIVAVNQNYAEILIFINNDVTKSVKVPLCNMTLKKPSFHALLLGSTSTQNIHITGSWYLSSLILFQKPIISKKIFLSIYTNGPNSTFTSTHKVRSNTPVCYSHIDISDSELDPNWKEFLDKCQVMDSEIHKSILLSYSAHTPTIMKVQYQSKQSSLGFSGKNKNMNLPLSLLTDWNGSPLLSQHKGLLPAIYIAGGPELLLFIYARVIELGGSPEQQANALYILLKVSFADSRLHHMFYENNIFSMLHFVFKSSKCAMCIYTVKAALEIACNCSLVEYINNEFHLICKSNAVIQYPDILVFLLQSWKHLEVLKEDIPQCPTLIKKAERKITLSTQDIIITNYDPLEVLLLSIEVLLRDNHPSRSFNIQQLGKVNMLGQLLFVCKERFLNTERSKMSEIASHSLVEIIGSLNIPPYSKNISHLVNFLILMHKASDTFVTHNTSNFYFLLGPVKMHQKKKISTDVLKMPFISRKRGKNYIRKQKHSKSLKLLRSMTLLSLEDLTVSKRCNQKHLPIISKNETLYTQSLPCGNIRRTKKTFIRGKWSKSITNNRWTDELRNHSKFTSNTIIDKKESDLNDFEVIETDEYENGVNNFSNKLQKPAILIKCLRSGSLYSWIICKGLLHLLKETIYIMPDNEFKEAIKATLHYDVLLVLCNHSEVSVRTNVVKLISALISRSSTEDVRKLEDSIFFHNLANQISQYQASEELVIACASLITGCHAPLRDQVEAVACVDVHDKSFVRSIPLLSVLQCTLHDETLLKGTLNVVESLIEQTSIEIMDKIYICEAVIKCFVMFGALENFNSHASVLKNMYKVFNLIIIKYIINQHNQQIDKIRSVLMILENLYNEGTCIRSKRIFSLIRDLHCMVLMIEFDNLEDQFGYTLRKKSIIESDSSCSTYDDAHIDVFMQRKGNRKLHIDLQTQLNSLLLNISSFIMNRALDIPISSRESNLVKKTFLLLLKLNEKTQLKTRTGSSGIDWFDVLNDLFQWIILPVYNCATLRTFVLQCIQESNNLKILLTPNDVSGQRKIGVYLKILLEKHHDDINKNQDLRDILFDWIGNLQLDANSSSIALCDEANHLTHLDVEYYKNKYTPSINSQKSEVNKDLLANSITENAMSITRFVVEIQNIQRKSFMNDLKLQQSVVVESAHKWLKTIEKYSHEKGPFYFESLYPNSQEMDPTEGPDRVRIRLKSCHLNIKKHFLKEGYNKSVDTIPLSYLFDSCEHSHDNLLQQLHLNESIRFMVHAIYVTVKCNERGELLLSDKCLHFVPESKKDIDPMIDRCWHLDQITNVVTRRWQLHERAVELFTLSGHAELLAFDTVADRELFMTKLNSCNLPNRFELDTLSESLNLWRNGDITNWKYLMNLNGLAGRTYNDLMQYPVMPFILADYVSNKLDLYSSKTYRDLAKPMAVQEKKNEKHYINNYNYLKQAKHENFSLMNVNREPFHYGSHYSNSGTVLHFLVRLPPFTNLFLDYQDNNFDIPDRTFHSMQTTWRLTSCDSTTDVKELIPEFFYLPHFLCNSEGLNFGVRQCGTLVDDIILPPWAENARLFILIHRQALESAYVKENIPNWIDLVFGHKQTGQAAIDAINVFHPATYYGFDVNSITDELERHAWETMVKTYGQTPRQLFKQPHPHCITDIGIVPESTIAVLPTVSGLQWGKYCGSPQEAIPIIIWKQQYTTPIERLIPLLSNDVIGVPVNTTLLLTYDNKGLLSSKNSLINNVDVISWGYPDGLIRIKQQKDSQLEPLFQINIVDQLRVVSHGINNASHAVWLGLQSGRIIVLTYEPTTSATTQVTQFFRSPTYLYGHDYEIVAIYVCDSFSVVATASQDGTVIIWDSNSLSYIRTILNSDQTNSTTNVSISETLCDIAVVQTSQGSQTEWKRCESNKTTMGNTKKISCGSRIKVYSVNGISVGQIKLTDQVTSICYSNAREGLSVNSIIAGLSTGMLKFFSSWDLKPLLTLSSNHASPIVSMVYSCDSQNLYVASKDGLLMVWNSSSKPVNSVNFRMLTSYPTF